MTVIADDSGLCVEALNGEPEFILQDIVKKVRISANVEKLVKKLEGVKNRKAKFVSCNKFG